MFAVQTAIQSLIAGYNSGMERNAQRQREVQQQLAAQRQAVAESLARQRSERDAQEADYRARLADEKAAGERALRGATIGAFGLKGGVDPGAAGLRSGGGSVFAAPTGALQQARCVRHLTEAADRASARGDDEESAFLDEQASAVMAGRPARVTCPDGGDLPSVPAVGATRDVTPVDRFLVAAMEVNRGVLDRLGTLSTQRTEREAQRQLAQGELAERRSTVAALRATPASAPATTAGGAPESDADLAAALRLLAESERQLGEAERALAETIGAERAAIGELERTDALVKQVQADPAQAEQALARLAPKR